MPVRRITDRIVSVASSFEARLIRFGARLIDEESGEVGGDGAIARVADWIDRAWESASTRLARYAGSRFEKPIASLREVLAEQARFSSRGLESLGVPEAERLRIPHSVTAASIVVNIFGLALPLAVLEVYDSIIPNQAVESLALLVAGFVILVVFEMMLRLARAYVSGLSAARFEARAMGEGLLRFASAPSDAFNGEPAAKHLSRLNAVSKLADFYGGQMRWTLIDLPFVVVFLAVMGLIGGAIALVPIAILVVFFALSAVSTQRLSKAMRARDEQDAKTYDFMTEVLSGIVTVKGAAMEPFMARRMERLLGQARDINRATILTSSETENLSSLLGNVTFIAIAAVGGIIAVFGDMSVGSLAACSLLAGRIIQPVLRAASVWRSMQSLRITQEDAATIFALARHEIAETKRQRVKKPRLEIYDQSGAMLLSAPFGALVAITGKDAAHKAQLLETIAGVAAHDTFRARFAGRGTADYRRAAARSILYCTPKSEALGGTLIDNLTLFNYGASLQDVLWACDLIGLRREIDRLPAGFETRIGEGANESLPSGMLQRVSLARAIALKPDMLVLDEPQALLDQEADRRLLFALSKLHRVFTIVVATNRPSYVAIADRAFHLDGGKLRAISTSSAVSGGVAASTIGRSA